MGQTDRRKAKQKQLLVIGAAGEGAGFPGQNARGCGERSGSQSNRPQELPAAGAPAQHTRLSADPPNLQCDPTVPEGFSYPPSSAGRGKKPPHSIPPTRTGSLLFSTCTPRCTPRVVSDGRYSKLQKKVGRRTAVEVPSPPPLTPSNVAREGQHFSLFSEVKQQGRASLISQLPFPMCF